jgi:Peptidase A4 family
MRARVLVIGVLTLMVSIGAVAFASAAPSGSTCKTVTITTRSHGRTTHRRARVCETAAIGLDRTTVTAVGGTVTVHYAATHATACALAVSPSIWHGRNPTPVRCRGASTFHVPPASAGRSWTLRFTARNQYRQIVGVARVLVATPAPTTLGVVTGYSSNWSGYALEGGGITGTQGTFTVPTLQPTTPGDTSEWVGVDGVSNGSLIQAGVHEEYNGRQVLIWPWWEVLPDAEQQIRSMTVHAGDNVTVTVRKLTGSVWQIALVDTTNGQAYSINRTYSGPATSAEWIVEAPSIGNSIAALGVFTPVTFSGLVVDGVQMSLDWLFMVDGGNHVISSPSALGQAGFTVAYGPAGP